MATAYLDTNLGELERIARDLAATKAQVSAAARRAVSKLARWIKSVSLREAARDTGIKRKVLKNRLLIGVRGTQYTARVWYGLNAVPLSALGPRQTATGVVAGPEQRRHAFIVERGGGRQVYRRALRDRRLPLAVQYKSIEDEFRRILLVDVNPKFREMFARYFEQELRWETVRGKDR
ncbi:hypothetical protein [Desulfocurvus sp. DL9XJH121]